MAMSKTFRLSSTTLPLLCMIAVAGCRSPLPKSATAPNASPAGTVNQSRLVRSEYKKGEIESLCTTALAKARSRFDEVGKLKPENRTIANTLLAFENALADLNDETAQLTFMNYVHLDSDIRKEAADCEEKLGVELVSIFARRDLYEAIRTQKERNKEEGRLKEQTLISFEQNGLKLPDDQLAKVKELQTQLTQKATQFSTRLNNDVSTVEFTEEELKGAKPDFLNRLKKTADGKFIVTTKSTDYLAVMENVSVDASRERMLKAYLNRGGPENTKLLEEAVQLRQKIAGLMQFKTWADYRTQPRMAKNTKAVTDFLGGLKKKLKRRNQQDMAQLLTFKKTLAPSTTSLNQWDIAYLSNQLLIRDYAVDQEEVRQYFPAETVVAGMFSVYSEILGVTYKEVPNAKVWAPGVKLYEIHDKGDNKLIGFFYTDFIPRPGKYGHAAAFPLISGRVLADGQYSLPVASVVANFTPPSGDKPSLLTHHEVETTFHEFGHIMHQTLTRAPYASLSGSNTAQDFVEAPSQMLENWVWQPEVMTRLSGLYHDPAKKLPPELIKKMVAAKDFQEGYSYTKQLLYASFDMTIHTEGGAVDTTKTFDDLYLSIMGMAPISGGRFPASFGHMMGGYDAGYYGYLWSKVFAQDMFSVFKKKGITNPEVGSRYRKVILERGNMQEAGDLLVEFLGRAPSSQAFYSDLHVQ